MTFFDRYAPYVPLRADVQSIAHFREGEPSRMTNTEIRPFTIEIPQDQLDDLKLRLERTRWTDEAEGSGWQHGISLDYMKELADYWQRTYDWRKQESALNALAQFKATVDGVDIHFIHERGKGPNPTPLLLSHGFPDSFYRYHEVIDRLTDPAKNGGDPNNSFDVIVPSLPGTGFSDRITLDIDANADLFAKLMCEVLGYSSFISADGDAGVHVSQALARRHLELLIGMHLTDVGYPDQNTDFSTLSPAELEMAQWGQTWFMDEGIGVNLIRRPNRKRSPMRSPTPPPISSAGSSRSSRSRIIPRRAYLRRRSIETGC